LLTIAGLLSVWNIQVFIYTHLLTYLGGSGFKILISGMSMNAEIEVQTDSSAVLPEDVIVNFENKQYVFVAKSKNEFEITEMRTGNTENGYVEVQATGNKKLNGAGIVTKGAYSLPMKMRNVED
jgi:cobalt-zinc-cadmium efflux system membrane fusion protein